MKPAHSCTAGPQRAATPDTDLRPSTSPTTPDGVLPMTSTKLIIAALIIPTLILIALVLAVAAVVHWL